MITAESLTYPTDTVIPVVHCLTQGDVEYCGVTVNVGSRDEAPDRYGLAHFIEHTIFKGTRTHRASYILNRMEQIGGELNAYTTKEETVVYTVAPRGGCRRAIGLIGDLVTGSVFPDRELDREREVIEDEIDSYDDSPSESVFDDFDELFFRGSALAHNILGTRESITRIDSAVCRDFLETYYTAGNMVFFYLGPTPVREVSKMVNRAFAAVPRHEAPLCRVVPPAVPQFREVKPVGSHQAHTVIGARIPGLNGSGRHALVLLGNILGGPGMNSMLNVALREKRGLVYTVDAQTSFYTDCGLLTVYFGCDTADVNRCMGLTTDIFSEMASHRISDSRLEAAKRQYLGQCVVAADNREQEALSMGRAMLHFRRVRDFAEIRDFILSLTPADIQEAAAMLTPDRLSSLTLK